ncbi:MAG: redoxin domain-containing protein [Bacteroidota bacterium]
MIKKRFANIFLCSILLSSNCLWGQEGEHTQEVFDLVLEQLDSTKFPMSQLKEKPISVIFFLSPECPLCENYSLTIRTLREQFSDDSVAFYGIFSGKYFSRELIQTYLATYNPQVIPLLDPTYQTKTLLEANVTPEAFVIDALGTQLYRGSIDNWIPALGKKRTVITRHYLRDVLHASLTGDEIPYTQTKAVGCFIE